MSEEIKYERISYEDWYKTKPLVKIQIIDKKLSKTKRQLNYKNKYPQ